MACLPFMFHYPIQRFSPSSSPPAQSGSRQRWRLFPSSLSSPTVCPAHRPSVFCSESSTHARHLSKPGSLWRPVLPAQLCCCLAWHQSVQPLLNVKSARLTCRPRPAPVRGSHCHHQLLSLVLRGFPDLAQVLPLLRLLKVLIKSIAG